MKQGKLLSSLFGTAALVLISCNPSSGVGGSQSIASISIECQVFYRSSLAEAPSEGKTITLTSSNAREAIELDNMVFTAQYLDDQFEGRSLMLSVSATDTDDQIMRQLYQLDAEKGLSNQFQGGHGFTGLGYVYHPTSPAEMQFFCEAR